MTCCCIFQHLTAAKCPTYEQVLSGLFYKHTNPHSPSPVTVIYNFHAKFACTATVREGERSAVETRLTFSLYIVYSSLQGWTSLAFKALGTYPNTQDPTLCTCMRFNYRQATQHFSFRYHTTWLVVLVIPRHRRLPQWMTRILFTAKNLGQTAL